VTHIPWSQLAATEKRHSDDNQFSANFNVILLTNPSNSNISALSREYVYQIMYQWNISNMDEMLVTGQKFDHKLEPCTAYTYTPYIPNAGKFINY